MTAVVPREPATPDPRAALARPWWRRPLPIALAVVLVITFLPWGYALVGLARKTAPDTLRDAAFGEQGEQLCVAARADIDALPPARDAKTAAERSVTLDQATDRVAQLSADLHRLAVTSDFDHVIVDPWLADWDRYVADRRAYAQKLLVDSKARFVITLRDGVDYTRLMDAMAEVNHMPACKVPGDV